MQVPYPVKKQSIQIFRVKLQFLQNPNLREISEKANEHEFHEHWLNPCDITL